MADSRPNTHAVIAHVADTPTADAALQDLSGEVGIDLDLVTHGTGDAFAAEVNGTDDDDSSKSRVGKWLMSLGQEREELVRLGENVKAGRHGLVINEVDERSTLDAIVAVLKRHGGEDIVYFGSWQTEDMSVRRSG